MGFHLTIDGWRKDRTPEGWKNPSYDFGEEGGVEDKIGIPNDGPDYVEVKQRLLSDVKSLGTLMQSEMPPLRRVYSSKMIRVFYGFGDASGSAFGSSLSGGGKVFFEYGKWCSIESKQSSNWRELKNLVDSLETWVKSHQLKGSQIFVFTDNSTAESAYWKGTSKSPLLCDLVLRLK